jgi:CCR4-NOT transcription complex subunit 1
MQQPDPFAADLVVDRLPSIQIAPTIRSDFLGTISRLPAFSKALNLQLSGKPGSFMRDVRQALLLDPEEATAQGTRYNVPLVNSTVLLCGVTALQNASPGVALPLAHPPSLDVFNFLIAELDPEGRYTVLSAIVNQLRYPNKHTYYFSCLVLYLFASNKTNELVQEQIARVLLERLVCNRPYPWGLLVTFIELIKNDSYAFQSANFIHCAPEIERLFESCVAHVGSGSSSSVAASTTQAAINEKK